MQPKIRRFTLSLAFAIAIAVAFGGAPTAQALPSRSSCFLGYYYCVNAAANVPDFSRRSVMGLDCAVDLIACVRSAIFG